MTPLAEARATGAMGKILRRVPAVMAAAAAIYLAATYATCLARSCSTSRFDLAFLAGLAILALVAALSLLPWHRFAPALLVVVIPLFAAMYLFEAVATNPYGAIASSSWSSCAITATAASRQSRNGRHTAMPPERAC